MTQQQQHTPLLELRNISVRHIKERRFFSANTWLQILQNIDLKMNAGDIVGIAGESGCGKKHAGTEHHGIDSIVAGWYFFKMARTALVKLEKLEITYSSSFKILPAP